MSTDTEKENYFITLICFLLIILWTYTVMSKLMDLDEFERQMYNQTISRSLADTLIWLLPIGEILTALLLCFSKTRLVGLIFSFIAMFIFTAYVALVLANYFGRTPCACGGVLSELGWHAHFWFNLFFLLLAGCGTWLTLRIKIRKQR